MAKLLHLASREKTGVVIVGHFRTGKEKKAHFKDKAFSLGVVEQLRLSSFPPHFQRLSRGR